MCCRIAFTKPIFSRNEMKTAIPPNGVTARSVSRRINRSSDNRASISRETGLSVAFDSIPLLSQILGANLVPEFRFSGLKGYRAIGYELENIPDASGGFGDIDFDDCLPAH